MSAECFDTENSLIQLTMILKMQKLKRGPLPSLSYENLEDFLNQSLWRNGAPSSLHEAVDQVLSIEVSDIVRFLSRRAIVDGSKADLKDFTDVIGGD